MSEPPGLTMGGAERIFFRRPGPTTHKEHTGFSPQRAQRNGVVRPHALPVTPTLTTGPQPRCIGPQRQVVWGTTECGGPETAMHHPARLRAPVAAGPHGSQLCAPSLLLFHLCPELSSVSPLLRRSGPQSSKASVILASNVRLHFITKPLTRMK